MIRLVQFRSVEGKRRAGVVDKTSGHISLIRSFDSTYELGKEAIRKNTDVEALVEQALSADSLDYDEILESKRILVPIDHPDEARCLVSLTGLTHMGSARSRNDMHAEETRQATTDSSRMFEIGVASGRPAPGEIGAQPEWAYKGDGRSIVPTESELVRPAFAEDGGEEAEVAGLYIIDETGSPWRIGFAIGNEFSDHRLEKSNYLYLAHSKLRQSSLGPELLVGELPESVEGTIRIIRAGCIVWSMPFESGEANMCHSIANLEHHHFKYDIFRRPGDLHVHFFGANHLSFSQGLEPREGDVFEIDVPLFGRPLRNTLKIQEDNRIIKVKVL